MMGSYDKQHPETIQKMFGSIASSYDKTNAILSFQLHRIWNRELIKAATSQRGNATKLCLADLCCGTGAISLPWLAEEKSPQEAILIDFCSEMLACAKRKATTLKLEQKHALRYIEADVQAMPLQSSAVDCAVMAYGIRNVKSPACCFQEVFRILKSSGSFALLELTEPNNALLRWGHRLYLKTALPLLGKLFAKNGEAYHYLSQSIQTFIKPDELTSLLEQVGFSSIKVRQLSYGIATLIVAHK